MTKTVNVRIGEVKIARRGEMLKTILGSCVGIGLIWREEKICGLAHCLLPRSPDSGFCLGGRFVDQAVRSLYALMKLKRARPSDVHAIVAGGANMTNLSNTRTTPRIGEANFRTAMSELKKKGVRILHSDGGGDQGRHLTIDSVHLTYDVQLISQATSEKDSVK